MNSKIEFGGIELRGCVRFDGMHDLPMYKLRVGAGGDTVRVRQHDVGRVVIEFGADASGHADLSMMTRGATGDLVVTAPMAHLGRRPRGSTRIDRVVARGSSGSRSSRAMRCERDEGSPCLRRRGQARA